LEISPITQNDCYAVINQSGDVGIYQHIFYDPLDNVVHQLDDMIFPGTHDYFLSAMPEIPPGYVGRLVIHADVRPIQRLFGNLPINVTNAG